VSTRCQLARWAALALLFALVIAPAYAAEVRVAAAADLNFPIKDLATGFEKTTGNRVLLSLGSSGNFFAQIENGAPFDVFFSADVDYPRRLAAEGYADRATLYVYAQGKLVVWAPRGGLDVRHLGIQALLAPGVEKIAIANPEHAPYGQAAVEALKHAGIYERVRSKLVLGENISQAAQFVDSGNAQVGIIALSIPLAAPMKNRGQYWEVPQTWYPPLEQAAVITKKARNGETAAAFLRYVRSPAGQAILRQYGFAAPPEAQP
jgi:molybdate transport system substrate-binding protein